MEILLKILDLVPYLANLLSESMQKLLRYGMPVVIRTTDGWFVQIGNNGQLWARTKNMQDATTFYVVSPQRPLESKPGAAISYRSSIALRSYNNFVSTHDQHPNEIWLTVPWCGEAETFTILNLPNDKRRTTDRWLRYGSELALSTHIGKIVGHDRTNEYRFFAAAERIDEWEICTFVEPGSPI
jgi:hypothetical protein